MLKIKETDVARPVVEYFTSLGYDVYKEVQVARYSSVADIVATLGRRVVVVECKTSLSMAVIEQAMDWRGSAHWVYVSTPHSRRDQAGRRLAGRVLKYLGIGHIEVAVMAGTCQVSLDSVLDRKARPDRILKSLVDAQRTYAEAGNCDSAYWTPFRQTCINLHYHVVTHPGCTLKEAVDSISHHYRTPTTAVSSLVKWIDTGKVPGVRREIGEDRKARLYATDRL